MTITPNGLPAWSRSADHIVYGGNLYKTNYQSQSVVNPRTDLGAEALCRMAADLAAVVATCPMAVVTLKSNDASPAAPTILAVNMMTGVRASSYAGDAAPTGFPSGARVSTGKNTLTFSASYADAYGIVQPFAPTHCTIGPQGTSFLDVSWSISGSVVTLACFDATGAALGDRTFSVAVY